MRELRIRSDGVYGFGFSAAELAAFMQAIGRIAQAEGVAESGYRILANHGAAAHQDVPHFHLHLFGGRDLGPMLRPPRD